MAVDNTEKREIRVPKPTPPPKQKIYNYEMPLNPIIPLTQSEGGEQPRCEVFHKLTELGLVDLVAPLRPDFPAMQMELRHILLSRREARWRNIQNPNQ